MPQRAQTALLNAVVTQLSALGLVSFAATPENAITRAAGATDLWERAGALDDAQAAHYRTLLDVEALLVLRPTAFQPSAKPREAVGTVECVVTIAGQSKPTRLEARKETGEVAGLPSLSGRSGSAESLLVNLLARRVADQIAAKLEGLPATRETTPPPAPVGGATAAQPGVSEAPRPPPATAPTPSAAAPSRAARPTETIAQFERETAKPGATPQRYMDLGDAYLGKSMWEAAERQYQMAARLDPLMPAPHVRLGDIYADRGLWNDAIYHYKLAVELAPSDIPIRVALARAYEKSGQLSLAESELELAAKVDPTNGSVQVARGDLLVKLGRNRDAEPAYLAALEAADPDTRAHQRLAALYADMDRPRDALKYYVLAAKSATDDQVPVVRREHYGTMMALADGMIEDAMRKSRDVFKDFEEGKLTREEAFYGLDACAKSTQDVARFVEMVTPPLDAKATHASREAAYALVKQADAYLRDYVDTNDHSLLEYALALRQQAVNDLRALRSRPAAP